MEVQASEVRSTFPASFVLPLSDASRSLDGWLELDTERVRFRNGAGLELGMRLDRVAGLSISVQAEDEMNADAGVAESDETEPHELPAEEFDGSDPPLQVMRLAGACGPAPVCWDLLISSEDAQTLGKELSAALGGKKLLMEGPSPSPDGITLKRDGELDDDLLPRIDERHAKLGSIWKTRRWRGQRGDTHPAAGDEDRAIVIRRRRVVALMVIAAALIIAIEVAVTLFLIPG